MQKKEDATYNIRGIFIIPEYGFMPTTFQRFVIFTKIFIHEPARCAKRNRRCHRNTI